MKDKVKISQTLQEAMKFPHVKEYVEKITKELGEPEFYLELDGKMAAKMKYPNLIYPVGDPIFIHIYRKKGSENQYIVLEPRLDDEGQKLYERIMDEMITVGHSLPVPDTHLEIADVLAKLYDMVVNVGKASKGIMAKFDTKVTVTKDQYDLIKYMLIRNRVGYGKLEPLFRDHYLEDIHCTGIGKIKMIHKVFGMIFSNIIFKNDLDLNNYIVEVTERVERPVSSAHSVVDAIMPDGSRANFIYGRDISLEGSSFTLRKFASVPVSVSQVVNWNTMSSEVAAYLWICLENGMNLFVCGETASGKTTTLNAISAFIRPDAKVFTVENTPEVTMPHDVWQHLLTREGGGKSSDVNYIDLLLAALRSRPNYIIVGEIRGEEGNIAFQAMQTGHAVMSTFHAGNVTALIQRLTGSPINVPITFIDNLNIVLIQTAVFRGDRFLRRVISVTELEKYYEPAKKMITRQVFDWDTQADKHHFRGLYNSYVLEKKIARMLGLQDPRAIYDVLFKRQKIIEKFIEHKIFNYFDVWEILKQYRYEGDGGLPFKLD